MNLCSMFAEAGHVWYLCIISNSSNAYANFYDEKTSLCHMLPRQRPRAATSTPTERLLAQHVSTYEPNTCQPMSPTRFNQRAQHVSIYQPYTCQPCDHTRVRCKPAETVQWRGKIIMDVTISMTKYTKSSRCNSYDATKMTKTISS